MPPADASSLTPGELWAHEELERLKAGRFTPAAIVRFLRASFARAGERRRERPALARQARRWMAAGAVAWVILAAAGRRGRWGLRWWTAVALMLDWHLGMVETEDGRERMLGPADALTLVRAWLVPAAADAPTPAVVALAGATDFLDGRFARAAQPTRIGRDLEGLVDGAFAVAALRGALARGWIGRPAVAAEGARLATGFAYALWVYFGRADAPNPALTRAARITTPVRVGGLLAAGAGHRRAAGALVTAGSAWSVLAVARSATSSGRSASGRSGPWRRPRRLGAWV